MEKTTLKTTVAAAFAMVLAESSQADMQMEKCQLNLNGESLIKAGMADCAGAGGNSCAGTNGSDDLNAWIYLPQGACGKITCGQVLK